MAEAARKPKERSPQLVGGLVLIAVGILFLLHNLSVLYVGSIFDFWPVFLIWIGYQNLRFPDEADDQKTGMWLLTIGSILLVLNLELFGLGWDQAWPLLMVGAGCVLIWQTLALPTASKQLQEDGNGS